MGYPSAAEFYERSNMADPDDDFNDLYRDDFIRAAGRVARRKLERLTLHQYQGALLKRGVYKRRSVVEEPKPLLDESMEYAGAVGTMVLDVVSYVDQSLTSRIDEVIAKVEEVDDFKMDVDQRVEEVKALVELVDEQMKDLSVRQDTSEWRLSEMRIEVGLLMTERADWER